MDKLTIIKKEMEQAFEYMQSGDCTMFETEAAYQAYMDGLAFALNVLGSYNKECASRWKVTFVDGTEKIVEAGDVLSVISQIDNYEEIVTFDCLPEEDGEEYFICPDCGEKVYLDECKTDKWWDDNGNHRMIYKCDCGYENYELD